MKVKVSRWFDAAGAAAIKTDPDSAPAVERGNVTVAADAGGSRTSPPRSKRRVVKTVEAGQAPTLAGAAKRIEQEETREHAIAEATNTPAVVERRNVTFFAPSSTVLTADRY